MQTSANAVEVAQTIQMVYRDLTARENVIINAVMLGLDPASARKRFDAAIEFAELHRGTIHVIVTDVVLPDMNGRAMAPPGPRIARFDMVSCFPRLALAVSCER